MGLPSVRASSSYGIKMGNLQFTPNLPDGNELASALHALILDELGLAAAIRWQARDLQRHAGMRFNLTLPAHTGPVDRDRSAAVFRIFWQALEVSRRANATEIEVAMHVDEDALTLVVEDNAGSTGRGGIQRAESPATWRMLREQVLLLGGTIEISGSQRQGTKLIVSMPSTGGVRGSADASSLA